MEPEEMKAEGIELRRDAFIKEVTIVYGDAFNRFGISRVKNEEGPIRLNGVEFTPDSRFSDLESGLFTIRYVRSDAEVGMEYQTLEERILNRKPAQLEIPEDSTPDTRLLLLQQILRALRENPKLADEMHFIIKYPAIACRPAKEGT